MTLRRELIDLDTYNLPSDVCMMSQSNSQSRSAIPANNSQQKLVAADYLAKNRTSGDRNGHHGVLSSSQDHSMGSSHPKVTARQWITVAILCFVNLINYMDRFTIAGELKFKIHLFLSKYTCCTTIKSN